MMTMRKSLISLFLLTFIATSAADKRAMTVEDLWAMERIGEVQLSPDGSQLVFELTRYSMEKNSGITSLWLLSTRGGEPRCLTSTETSSRMPRWTPDGAAISFLSSRNGKSEIYLLPLNGGEPSVLTDFPLDIESYIWSPNGHRLAFTAVVNPQATGIEESAAWNKAAQESAVKAYIVDQLLFRTWNQWIVNKKNHVFICDALGKNYRDMTPGDYNSPPLDLTGLQDYVFSPNSEMLAFVSNRTAMPAANTNNDIFLILDENNEICLTADNEAVDNFPIFSPDGNLLAYKAMKRPGFEADEYDIKIYDLRNKSVISLTDHFDLSPEEMIWSPDGKTILFNAEERGREPIYRIDLSSRKIEKLISDHMNSSLMISPDGKTLYFKRQSSIMPNELFAMDLAKRAIRRLSFINQPLLSELELYAVEDFTFTSFDGQQAHGFLVKPPFFDPQNKYPLIYLIHGGPQGMWADDFHYRWNTELFASRGYVVAAVNFRGSKGYGQEWCDAVSKDWGGGPYQDLMSGLDYLVQNYSFIDANKVAAAGASFGGYMINWIATQTDRFKALVSHAGAFDLRSKYGSTEELWFPEWEFGGTPYEQPELYEKWSPSVYVENWRKFSTPTLVTHGERDYRVPVNQALQMFTALQRMGVPSRLIVFPDEDHFVSKPQNARLWWNEVFDWIERWIK
ncbi:MAG: S9 family peptidase [Calditrichaeota bacterium]|nr:MAG: S9 family peptidase [Calditrichota bacterium]